MKTVMPALLALLALLLAIPASADTQSAKSQELAARVKYLECRVHLQTDRIDVYATVPGLPDLSSHKAALEADLAQLAGLTGDKAAFKAYLEGPFETHLRAAKGAVSAAKAQFKDKNATVLPKPERAALKAKINAVKPAYEACRSGALNGRILARIAFITAWVEKWNAIIVTMREQGYQTATLEAVVAQAQTQVLPRLQAAIDEETHAAKKAALKDARELHLHLWANFAISRLRLYLGRLSTADPSEMAKINALLDRAAALAAPGRTYAPGEFDQVWSNIKEAAKLTKALARGR